MRSKMRCNKRWKAREGGDSLEKRAGENRAREEVTIIRRRRRCD